MVTASTSGGGGEGTRSPPPPPSAQQQALVPDDPREYDIYGCLFKRRGGTVGKYLGWKPRVFTLYQGVLCYYEGDYLEEVDRYRPRGLFRLHDRGVTFAVQDGPPPGSSKYPGPSDPSAPPTDWLLWIMGGSSAENAKWKLCAPSREDLDDWVKALSVYLGEPVSGMLSSTDPPPSGPHPSRRSSMEGGGSSLAALPTPVPLADTPTSPPGASLSPSSSSPAPTGFLRMRRRSNGEPSSSTPHDAPAPPVLLDPSLVPPVITVPQHSRRTTADDHDPPIVMSPLHSSATGGGGDAITPSSSSPYTRVHASLLHSPPPSPPDHASSPPPSSVGLVHRRQRSDNHLSSAAAGGGHHHPPALHRRASSSIAPGLAMVVESPLVVGQGPTGLTQQEVWGALLAANLVLMLARSAPPVPYTIVVLLANITLHWCLQRSLWSVPGGGSVSRALRWGAYRLLDERLKPLLLWLGWRPGLHRSVSALAKLGGSSRAVGPTSSLERAVQQQQEEQDRGQQHLHKKSGSSVRFGIPKMPAKMPPIGTTVLRTTAALSENPDWPAPPHSYAPTSASNIKVRSATYRHDGRKEPSLPAMYELLHFDLYRTPQRLNHVASLMTDLPRVARDALVPPHVPRLLVINWQAPSDPPSILAGEDGPGYSCVFYLGITEATANALRPLMGLGAGNDPLGLSTTGSSVPPHIRLLSDYFRLAPDSAEWKGRLKCIAHCRNLRELGLPSFIDKCNGKPVLLNKSVSLTRGQGYVQMDINMHRFGYPARKGLHFLNERFKEVSFLMGFLIEGRSDDELPEVLLGCCRFNRIDLKRAVPLTYFNNQLTAMAPAGEQQHEGQQGGSSKEQQHSRTGSAA